MSYTSKTNLKTDVSNLLTIVITKADHTSANDLIIDGLALETDLLKLKYGLTYVWTSSQTEDPNVGITPPISPSDQEKGLTLEGANAGDIWEYDSGAGNWVKLYNANDAPIADIQNKVDKILGISGSVYNDSIPVISVQDETGAEISGTGDANIKTSGYKIADFILKKNPITFTIGNLTRFTAAGDIEDAGASVTDFAYSRFLGLGSGSTGDVAVTGALLDLAIEDAPLSGNIGIKQVYEVTGSGSVDYVDNANLSSGLWERGRIVKLNFQSTVTFNHDTAIANPGDEVPFLLLSSSNTTYNSGDSRYFECIDDSGDLKLKELTLEVISAGGYGTYEVTVSGAVGVPTNNADYGTVKEAFDAGYFRVLIIGDTTDSVDIPMSTSKDYYISSIGWNVKWIMSNNIKFTGSNVAKLIIENVHIEHDYTNSTASITQDLTNYINYIEINKCYIDMVTQTSAGGIFRDIVYDDKSFNLIDSVIYLADNSLFLRNYLTTDDYRDHTITNCHFIGAGASSKFYYDNLYTGVINNCKFTGTFDNMSLQRAVNLDFAQAIINTIISYYGGYCSIIIAPNSEVAVGRNSSISDSEFNGISDTSTIQYSAIKGCQFTGNVNFGSTNSPIELSVEGCTFLGTVLVGINALDIDFIACQFRDTVTMTGNRISINSCRVRADKNIVINGDNNKVSNSNIGTTNGGTATININGDDNQVEGNFVEAAVLNSGVNNNVQYKLF